MSSYEKSTGQIYPKTMKCNACGEVFESSAQAGSCPACKSSDVKKIQRTLPISQEKEKTDGDAK
jgi:Zn finger protein HypA/HybF involved in hydrogenase expression